MSKIDFKKVAEEAKKRKKPLIVFSEAFVRAGGFISVSINYETLGSQIGAVINKFITSDKWVSESLSPIGTYLVIHRGIAKDFNYSIPASTYRMLANVIID
jgi:ABC-type uncharacterized transport system substrate-binding protein